MPVRTFIAVDLDEALRDDLGELASRVDTPGARVRWVDRTQLHVTLKFLGDVDDPRVDELCRQTAAAAAGLTPFEIGVRRVQVMPPRGQVRMIWAGVDDPAGGMARLFETVETRLEQIGFPREGRRFRPHITLARIKAAREPGAVRRAVEGVRARDFGRQRVAAGTVYSSVLTPDGPVYAPLASAPLGGGGAGTE